jgi:arsenate reductase
METVLFACVRNAGRSQMAAAFFDHLANPAKARACSAGTSPAPAVHEEVVVVMAEVGIDLRSARPRALTDELVNGAEWLITMGCRDSCATPQRVKRADWELPDPDGQPIDEVRRTRDEILQRVRALVAEHGWT